MNKITVWSEKYRPTNLSEIIHQKETISVIKNLLKNSSIPHLIFYGPPGTGKTSTILSIANEIYPEEIKKYRFFEFNASDDRGIKFIREKIKKISTLKISSYKDTPNIKIILLDEVDTLTPDSQYALRRIMEDSSFNTRFCLICNYPNKLIEPIISRCAQFRFKPIPSDIMENKLKYILSQENTKNNPQVLNTIINYSYGDLRLAISYLQRYFEYQEPLENIFGIIDINVLIKLFKNANNETKLWEDIKNIIQQNYHISIQIKSLLELVSKLSIDDDSKINIINDITNIDHYVIKGVNNEILWNFLGLSLLTNLN